MEQRPVRVAREKKIEDSIRPQTGHRNDQPVQQMLCQLLVREQSSTVIINETRRDGREERDVQIFRDKFHCNFLDCESIRVLFVYIIEFLDTFALRLTSLTNTRVAVIVISCKL